MNQAALKARSGGYTRTCGLFASSRERSRVLHWTGNFVRSNRCIYKERERTASPSVCTISTAHNSRAPQRSRQCLKKRSEAATRLQSSSRSNQENRTNLSVAKEFRDQSMISVGTSLYLTTKETRTVSIPSTSKMRNTMSDSIYSLRSELSVRGKVVVVHANIG